MADWMTIIRADGSQRKVSGYKLGSPRGVPEFEPSGAGLPPRVDLRPFMTAVEDQGDTNSCTANAVAGAYEYLVKRHLADGAYDVSRLFIYYNARAVDDCEDEDEGSVIGSAIESLKEDGACSETTWPFDEDEVNTEPGDEAYDEAASFLVEDTRIVPTTIEAWKSALAEGYPIIFGLKLFGSFDKHRRRGLVPAPSDKEAKRESHGGHAMLCVGYSDKDQVFIVRNSWGEEWGDRGYCYIPYRYILNPDYNFGDSWIIRRLDNFDPDDVIYADDDTSLLEEYDTEFEDWSDEEWNEMIDDMGDTPLEYRIGLIMLSGVDADDDISDDELEAVADYMDQTLDALGSDYSARKILKFCKRSLGDEELLEESVELLGEYLSNEMLARITNDLEKLMDADDEVSDDEESFLDELIEMWQVGSDSDDDDDDDDDH